MRISDWSSDVCSSDLLATAVTGEWCRAQNDDAGRCRRVPDNREMVGWKIRVRNERPTPSAGPDDSARVAQRQRLQHIGRGRSAEHTSELQSLMSTSYADFCLK